ncbi:MAG: outer membrane lipoprotein-sorting protein [Methylococcaceae bacterium]
MVFKVASFFLVLLLFFPGHSYADWYDSLVDEWNEFSKVTGQKQHADWAKLLANPESAKLAREWADLRGYSAHQLIDSAKLPPELKPGLVINKSNIDSFPWLSDYLNPASLERIKSDDWFAWDEVVIVPTNSYYMNRGRLEATKEAQQKGTIYTATPDGNLLTQDGKHALLSQGGLPFIHPKNGLELNWLFVSHGVGTEDIVLNPIKMTVCGSNNKLDRKYEGLGWWKKFHGRQMNEPLGDVPNRDGVVEGGAFIFTKPFDVRGLAVVRMRFADAKKDDDFRIYLPGLKRTRRLSGSDGQDPMAAGLEVTWDDWRGMWVKTEPGRFEYKLVGEKFLLSATDTGHVYNSMTRNGDCHLKRLELELRPVWILEIINTDDTYQYSKRKIYIDKEWYYLQYQEMYDKRGNLWRIGDEIRDFNPLTGEASWSSGVLWNPISNRFGFMSAETDWEQIGNGAPRPAIFNIEILRDRQ